MGTDCGHSFIKLYNFACTGVNHNPQMKIAPSELCLWEEEKKKTQHDTKHSLTPSHDSKLLQVGHNQKREFYVEFRVGEGNVTMQNPLTA